MASPLTYSRVNQPPVTGDPVHLKSTSPNSSAASADTATGYPSTTCSATATTGQENDSPQEPPEWIPALAILLAVLVIPILTTIYYFLLPSTPNFTLVSTSVAVHNVSSNYAMGDMNVSLAIKNLDRKGMTYKNLTFLAKLYDHGHDRDRDYIWGAATVAPFEQGGYASNTVMFSLKDIKIPITNGDDGIILAARDNSSTSAWFSVWFRLKVRVRYNGKTVTKKEITVNGYCGKARLGFMLNNGFDVTATTKLLNSYARDCETDGFEDSAVECTFKRLLIGYVILVIIVKFVWSMFALCRDPSVRSHISSGNKIAPEMLV